MSSAQVDSMPNVRGSSADPSWRAALAPYAEPRLGRSLLDLATSLPPYLALMVAMYFLLNVSYWLVLAVSILAAGFLVRTFIIFHDCAHGSFLPSKRANALLGAACGLFVMAPFQAWKHEHAVHHATSGDLERRGIGDVPMLTVAEYDASPWYLRLGYRLFRNPAVMFGIGPLWAMVLQPRFISRSERPRIRRSKWRTDVAIAAAIGLCCWLIGWERFLLLDAPSALMAGSIGVWLFYVQHQYEQGYWKDSASWSYEEAALRGASYLKLPKVLQFFTGNIGLHHVHHLSARIPNYNLQGAHDALPLFREVPTLSLWGGIRCVKLKLWDEEHGRLVTFRQARLRAIPTPVTGFELDPAETPG